MMEAGLHESEDSYRRVFEHAPIGMILTDPESLRVKHVNHVLCLTMGYRQDELIGKTFQDITHPEDIEKSLGYVQRLMASELQSYQMEKRYIKKSGEILWASLTVSRVSDAAGKPMYFLVMIEDIGERKLAREQQLAQAAAQRYSLVREVHHRIKNNLQSVVGLLGRELGGHAELHPRLEVAVSQVNAIATVHGLQSAGSNETIMLCETLEEICKAIGAQTRQTIQWRIEGASIGFLPVQIAEDEAVPIALVLNELIFNAVKHTPPGAPAPAVSLESDGVSSRVRIGNSAAVGGSFDIINGQGLNTGLRLVLSLMPAQGAVLAYSGIGTDRVLTDLRLTAPVVVPIVEGGSP